MTAPVLTSFLMPDHSEGYPTRTGLSGNLGRNDGTVTLTGRGSVVSDRSNRRTVTGPVGDGKEVWLQT